MTERKSIQLVKAAKELNVGINTIVEHLAEKGHEIADRPSTKLTPDQYDILLSAFKQDYAIKKKAEEINIGKLRKEKAEEAKEDAQETFIERPKVEVKGFKVVGKLDLDAPQVEEKKEEAAPKEEVVVQEKKEEVKEVVAEKEKEEVIDLTSQVEMKGPKVVGSIDLEAKKKPKPAPKPAAEKKKEAPKAKTPAAAPTAPEVKAPEVVVEKTDTEEKGEDKIIRAEAERLEGVKVMGKIELPVERSASDKKSAKSTTSKRRRRRVGGKAVDVTQVNDKGASSSDRFAGRGRRGPATAAGGANKKSRRRRKTDEPQAISGKEIDDKIRATMAKIGGTQRSRSRRKTRRDEVVSKEVGEEASIIQVTEFISVSELASIMDVTPTQVISACFGLGVIVSINQRVDAEIIELVASEFGFEVEFISITDESEEEEEEDAPEDLKPRSPIVTIMGHVDHGKTSLLDYVRSANIVAGEAGGITQHIGAYEVTLPETKQKVTFLDTPGHEAFTAMRARGAKLTDIVIVVIAADDNVMPQTKEALSHAQAAEVPIVIAINKIDKPTANPDNIKKQLAEINVLVEDWGGKYQCQEISAKKGTGIDELLSKILLEAELLELKANPDKLASGSVIEAELDRGRGYVTTIMVQEGTLEIGDFVVAGQYYGKVRALNNERGARVEKAGPSQPVQLLGLNGAPTSGDRFKVYESEQEAKDIASKRSTIMREQGIRAQKHITLDEIGRRLALGTFKELKIIVKGDVDGSVEALSDSLLKLSTEEIQVSIVLQGVGAITENDVQLAVASDAIIVAFQVRPTTNARELAESESIEIRNYSIIYDAIDDVKKAMEGMLEPKFEEKVVGNVEVREVFKISKVGTIAGCYVQDGKIARSSSIRVIREGIVVHTGELDALKRFKDDVREVTKGFECGIKVKNFNDIRVDDVIEAYEQVELKRKL